MFAGEEIMHIDTSTLYLLPMTCDQISDDSHQITIAITNYRILISFVSCSRSRIEMPLMMIASLGRGRLNDTCWVDVQSKHVWCFRIAAPSAEQIELLAALLDGSIPNKREYLFAYPHFDALRSGVLNDTPGTSSSDPATVAITKGEFDPGWTIGNAQKELERQTTIDECADVGLGTNILPWYQVVSLEPAMTFQTYPVQVVVPKRATLDLLQKAAKFRQNARIPVISWIHIDTGGCIARAGQPLVGPGRRCREDELLCSYLNQSFHSHTAKGTPSSSPTTDPPVALAACNEGPPPPLYDEGKQHRRIVRLPGEEPRCEGRLLHICDCRSRAAAAANMANGGGFEITQYYDRVKLHFFQLDNIHAVNRTFEKLTKLCHTLQGVAREAPTAKSYAGSFYSKLENTGWILMTQKLLWASSRVTDFVCDGGSALLHCTDGWDRTPQVACLAMLMLDSYYRTIEGFCLLIIREWLNMGHRFGERCGHDKESDDFVFVDELEEDTIPETSPKPRSSPIFIQFIDAVYQLLKMFPADFEFTPQFLAVIVDHVYSCRFGTFMFNCYRSRYRRNGVVTTTASLWTEIERMYRVEKTMAHPVVASERIINPFFNEKLFRTMKSTGKRLVPSFHAKRYCFWAAWYCRFDGDASGATSLEPEGLTPLIESFLSMHPYTCNVGTDVSLFPYRVPPSQIMTEWVVVAQPPPGVESSEPSSPTSTPNGSSIAYTPWPDDAKCCALCGAVFTMFNRRHACRSCGKPVCGSCGSNFALLPKGSIVLYEEKDVTSAVRVCNVCATQLLSRDASPQSSVTKTKDADET